MNKERNPLIEFNLQELKKLLETHKAINKVPSLISDSSSWAIDEPAKVYCDGELTYMELYSKGKSNIIYNLWVEKLLENKRISDEFVKLLLEKNPREEKCDLKNSILKIRPK